MQDYLTVRELADLLRIKERKVYDLASSGAVPCSKVTGKLLFPEAEIRAWIASGTQGGAAAAAPEAPPRPPVFLGSHDPLLDWALRQSDCGLAQLLDASRTGLARFAAGEGVAAGLHLIDPASGQWNVPDVAAAGVSAVLLGFATRSRGIVCQPERVADITGLADLAGSRIVPRQPDSGSAVLFGHLCAEAGLAPDVFDLTPPARSETDAVAIVARGEADATLGLAAPAAAHGLGFVPLLAEPFDLLVDRRAYFEPPFQRFAAFLASDAFVAEAARMPGYDITDCGRVKWNG